MAGFQKGSRHVGKVPATGVEDIENDSKTASLKRNLEKAIATEHYEEAAKLRDAIRLQKAGGESIIKGKRKIKSES